MKKRNKNKINEQIFQMTFWIWVIPQSLAITEYSSLFYEFVHYLNSFIDYLVLVLLVAQIVYFQKYKGVELKRILLVAAVIVISALKSSDFTLLSLLLLIIATKSIDVDKIIKSYGQFLAFFILFILLSCAFGIIEDIVIFRDVNRHSLGFSHPNVLGIEVAELTIIYLYIKRHSSLIKQGIVSLIIVLFLYFVPNSRTAYVLVALTFVFNSIVKALKNNERYIKRFESILMVGSIVINAVSIFLCTRDGSMILKLLSLSGTTFSARFLGGYDAFSYYGVKLFGQKIVLDVETNSGMQHLWLDNSYITILIQFGLVIFLLFSFLYIKLMYQQAKNPYIVNILFVYSLYGLMEPTMFKIISNVFLIYFGQLIYAPRKNRASFRFKIRRRKRLHKKSRRFENNGEH